MVTFCLPDPDFEPNINRFQPAYCGEKMWVGHVPWHDAPPERHCGNCTFELQRRLGID